MPSPDDQTLLRCLVADRHWRTFAVFDRHFQAAARKLADAGETVGIVTTSEAQFERWLDGKVKRPRAGAVQVLEHLFGLDIETLLGPAGQYRPQAAAPYDLGAEIMSTAHEASEHAGLTAARAVEETSIEQLAIDVAQVARDYPRVSPVASWAEAKRIRSQALSLLDRTGRPNQEAELYLILGEADGVMATASFDLGLPQAAGELAGSAFMYGTTIGHSGLCAWSQGMRALILYWTGFPGLALAAVGKGLSLAPAGTATVRLRAIQARAHAHNGNGPAALDSARLARLELEAGADPEEVHDTVGGEFGFAPARLARCLASAHGRLGQADQEIAEAQRALHLYAAGPDEQRMPKIEAEAWIELGHGHLLNGDLDAADAAFAHVFTIEPDARVEGITGRLLQVRGLIAADGRLASARLGKTLSEKIEAFAELSAGSRLPALPPGPS